MVRDISIVSPSLTGVFIGSWQIWYRIEVHADEAILNSRAHLTPERCAGAARDGALWPAVLPMHPQYHPTPLSHSWSPPMMGWSPPMMGWSLRTRLRLRSEHHLPVFCVSVPSADQAHRDAAQYATECHAYRGTAVALLQDEAHGHLGLVMTTETLVFALFAL